MTTMALPRVQPIRPTWRKDPFDQRMPVAPALMILFQIERHDSELHRPCSVAPHDPAILRTIPLSRRGVYRVWGAALLLLGLYLVPVLVSFCLPDPRGGVPWHQARRDPTGLSPDPAVTQEAVIQVFAAPAVAWRGLLSVHTWIAVKPAGGPRFTRYEVLGFGVANGAPAVRIDRMGPEITGSGLGRTYRSSGAGQGSMQ